MHSTHIGGLTYSFTKDDFATYSEGIKREWVQANGLGGYCGTSIIDSPMRKHHGLLIASLHSPIQRYLILSKLNETITIGDKTYPLHTTKYKDSLTNGFKHIESFYYDTYPIYTYKVQGTQVSKEIIIKYGYNSTVIKYTIINGNSPSTLTFNPCFNFRPHGDSSTMNDFLFEKSLKDNQLILKPKKSLNDSHHIISYRISEGSFSNNLAEYDKDNYLDFEFATGMIGLDTHFVPYNHELKLQPNETKEFYIQCEVIEGDNKFDCLLTDTIDLKGYYDSTYNQHIKRMHSLIDTSGATSDLKKRLVISADQFIANRKSTGLKTILAGLPWFSDWGRDTMIALCGLTLSTNQYVTAKEIIQSFAKYIHNGLLPNMFPDEGLKPLYNSVDASLWYFQAVYQYLCGTNDKSLVIDLYPTLINIYESFVKGTDFSIYMDDDSLIHAGSGLDQVTWMDVRINGIVVTPRHGKPVEINALWYNGLKIMEVFTDIIQENCSSFSSKFCFEELEDYKHSFGSLSEQVKTSFNEKFWNDDIQCLNDVVDDTDSSIRPNQIYAVSLPFTMLDADKNRKIVETVYNKLYTPYGLRSLSVDHKDYKGIYAGELIDRDFAYHQGTVWGFLLGGFITAYAKVNPTFGKADIIQKFIKPIEEHLSEGCLGGFAEIFDGDTPHNHRGCYTQAWSIAETLRALCELEK